MLKLTHMRVGFFCDATILFAFSQSPSHPYIPPVEPACSHPSQVDLDKSGYVLVKDNSVATSVPGVFAAGDLKVGRHPVREASR